MTNNTPVILEQKPVSDQDILQSVFKTRDADQISKRSLISVMRRQQERMNILIEALFKENPNHQLFRNISEEKRKELFLKRFEKH